MIFFLNYFYSSSDFFFKFYFYFFILFYFFVFLKGEERYWIMHIVCKIEHEIDNQVWVFWKMIN